MPESVRLAGGRYWTDLAFVECERTPMRAIALGIQIHMAESSVLNTISVIYM